MISFDSSPDDEAFPSSELSSGNASVFQTLIGGLRNWTREKNQNDGLFKRVRADIGLKESKNTIDDWLAFQLHWILWTFASYERKFPAMYFGALLTYDNVLEALRFRYNLYVGGVLARKICLEPTTTILSPVRPNKIGLVPCHRHFSMSSSMSPLQRCTEIQTFLWPLVLCISIIVDHSGGYYETPAKNSNQAARATVRVTDGWWWTTALVDISLYNLIVQKKLVDGCKIVVFAATFEADSSENAVIKLSINTTRRARSDALLGYCRPRFLSRGLGLKSLVVDGGSVFAAKVKILSLSQPMAKVVFYTSGVNERKFIFLDHEEVNEVSKFIEGSKSRYLQSMESSEELNLRDILEDIDCDDYVKSLMLGNEPDGELSREVLAQIDRVKQKIREAQQSIINENLNNTGNGVPKVSKYLIISQILK